MVRNSLFAIAALVLAPTAANAQNFNDNFDSEGTPGSHLNYSGFANFTTTGQVDLVASPDYGIICGGKCVDLDGTSGPGAMLSNAIAFTAGHTVKISFDVGGSQRSSASDSFSFAALFGSPTGVNALNTLSGFPSAPALVGNFANVTSISYGTMIAGNAGFTTYSLFFTPTASGTLQLSFGTTSADNIGPLLDNVSVVAVPEPAAWGMMIGGFGLAGMAVRRRAAKTKVSFA
jgi:hypothetical protein